RPSSEFPLCVPAHRMAIPAINGLWVTWVPRNGTFFSGPRFAAVDGPGRADFGRVRMASKNGSSWSDAGEVPAPARKGLSQSRQPTVKGESVAREKDEAVDGAAMEQDAGMKPQPPAKALTRE